MSEPIPDKNWYISRSTSLGLLPRCPFASTHKCPRYYQSLSLLGDAGFTKIDKEEDIKLLAKWKKHALWPHTMEQATGISSSGSRPSGYHHFCPEVAYDAFDYFATFLARYADEMDSAFAHKRLAKEGANSNDPGWNWQFTTAQHYSECPLYSPLAHADALSHQQPGIAVNKKSLRRRTSRPSTSKFTATEQREAIQEKPTSSKSSEKRKVVFISYAHSDLKWLVRLQRHLKPLLRGKTIDAWSDKRIKSSDKWHEQIQTSLAGSCAAVLFISPDFLASDYIADHELPIILKGASENGLKIFSLVLSPCAFQEAEFTFLDGKNGPQTTTLSVFQAANSPTRTLVEMKRADCERTLLQTAKDIANLKGP